MDFAAVGKKIKELRKNSGLSQEELAEGVCTQAQISKIEKGDVFPYASTLYQISQKLGVDVNYFFDIGTTPRLDYVQEVFQQLQILRRSLKFEEMMEIVRAEEHNPLFMQNNKNKQILLWHKGIYLYEVRKDLDKSVETLQEAINITSLKGKILQERELEILLSLGAIYFNEDLDKALEVFEEIKVHLQILPHLNNYSIKTRLLYNLARVLTRLVRIEESNKYCEDAIKWALHKDSLYLLGELHYQIGYNLELLNQPQKAKSYMEKALIVFELQEDDKYINFIRNKIKELSEVK
ncbi:helix-turn-helix domain-containing protein [Rossellomorea yichunensis]|jgi:transcriptional regulator with XRE-family HTH domain|uniref:helix-turn-helix domain-containing protein n=1 Tax=Rossellomorea yichunensis TaxID=3077331 RepID=UPI0028DD6EDF|nr:helix-turn-helix domain-containing protein [Rossellomorea sp. YC4-1]MDT9026800.1 helix-turn-helix domain-containing protein [Rossellomorea sp. YC4-1]